MNYANIKYFDIADGEGVRTSLFVSGCRRGCKNCFNSVAWDFAAGEPFDRAVEDKIIESLDHPFIDGLTILGGEPMEPENQAGLVDFIERVRAAYPAGSGKTIWCFTGDVLEELMPGWPPPYRGDGPYPSLPRHVGGRPVRSGSVRYLVAL